MPDGIAVDLLFAAQPFTGLEHHALHILRGLRAVGVSVDVLVPRDVLPDLGDAAEGHRLPELTTVKVPDGVDSAAVRGTLLDRYDIEIGAGAGEFANSVWRIGLMGRNAQPQTVTLLLGALAEILGR